MMTNIKKRAIAMIVSLAVAFSCIPITSYAEATMPGSGTESDPYQISTKYQLDEVRNDLEAHYILMDDIVFSEEDFKSGGEFYNNGGLWKPLSGGTANNDEGGGFRGTFDGNGHIINGIKLGKDAGIFGKCINATIKDLTLRNIQSKGPIVGYYLRKTNVTDCAIKDSSITSYAGAFANITENCTFTNCINYACITDSEAKEVSGGFVASDSGSTFTDCVNYGNINTLLCAGGIVGFSAGSSTEIVNCENHGNITATAVNSSEYGFGGACAGGLVGFMMSAGTVKTSFNNATVTAKTDSYSAAAKAGGISAENRGSIVDCYNSGEIIGSGSEEEMVANVGGISGVCSNTIINSFNTGKIKSVYRAGGITAYLKGENARISKSYNSGDVSAVEVVSGVASQVSSGATISNTYYLDESVSATKVVPSNDTAVSPTTATVKKNGTPLTSAEMKKKASYKNYDFSSKWTISSTNAYKYPTLRKVSYKPQIKATGMKLNTSTKTMTVKSTYRLSPSFTPTNTTNKLVKWSSNNSAVAKVDATGKITALKEGTATITCKSRVGGKTATCKVTVVNKLIELSTTKYVYDGKAKRPTVTVEGEGGKKLVKGTDFDVTYASGRIKVGRYKVAVTFKGKYSGTKNVYFTIVPKAPSSASTNLSSASQTKGYDDIKFTWKASTGATGYLVYYKKASASTWSGPVSTTKTSYTKKDLSDGVKYTFKVVPYYKTSTGTTKYYSADQYKTASVYTLKKLSTPTVSTSGTKAKVKWTNINGETGYQISKSTSKNGTNIVSTYATTTGTSKTVSATKGKTYYYKVRAYKTVGDKKVYSPWSNTKAFTR